MSNLAMCVTILLEVAVFACLGWLFVDTVLLGVIYFIIVLVVYWGTMEWFRRLNIKGE